MNSTATSQNPPEALERIQTLARSDINRNASPKDWLAKIAPMFGSDAGILWDASQPFRVLATYSNDESPPMVQMRQEEHEKLLTEVVAGGGPNLLQTRVGDTQQANLLLLGKIEGHNVGLVELIIENHQLDPSELRSLERRFRDTLQLISVSNFTFSAGTVPSAQKGPADSAILDAEQLSGFLSLIHGSIDLPLTSNHVVNESRRFLDYDRVSVLVERRGKLRLIAISGQSSVNHRSNTTRLLEQLAASALKTGQEFWYPDAEDLPSPIRTALDEYVHVSQTRSMSIIPIRKMGQQPSDPSEAGELQPVIGGIVFEKFQELWDRNLEAPRVQRIALHSGHAIGNALQHQQIFLYPLWRFLGRSSALVHPKHLNKTLAVLGAVAIILLVLLFWPVRFYVSADGILIPSRYKPVFSNVEGEIEEVLVEHGQRVTEGQELVRMSSREHDFRIEEINSQLKTARQRLTIVEDQRHNPNREETAEEIEENLVSLRTQIENFQAQLAVLDKISQKQTVRSPLDGHVITWDLKRQLQNRVVTSGVRLMEVADIDGQWMIEIDLPIRRQGHVARAIRDGNPEDLKISFLLAADTSKKYVGRVVEIADVVAISDDNRQVIKMRATIQDSEITIDQVRSAVSAKVYCGKSSLGYLWFHDIGEAIQKHVLFRFF